MTDRIFINGLMLHAFHGVMRHEAEVGQTFALDIELETDLSLASRTDKLADTVGYDEAIHMTSAIFCAKPYKLIEAAAGAVADALLHAHPMIAGVRVTVRKPHAPIAASFRDVGISIYRTR